MLFVAALSPSHRVTSALVAESTGSNAVVIRNLFVDLSRNGLLTAAAGKGGGVSLAKDPKDINLWEIYEAVETDDVKEIFKIHESSCDSKDSIVGKNFFQVLYPHMQSAVEAMKESMQQVTLEILLCELIALVKAKQAEGMDFKDICDVKLDIGSIGLPTMTADAIADKDTDTDDKDTSACTVHDE